MDLETIIGLEIHVQLKTKSKMFCGCDNRSEGAAPNTLICPICTGHPGTLPVPNIQAVRWAVMTARAVGCTVPEHAKFDRKHYFYPDLPKGYQISQYDEPIGVHGSLAVVAGGVEQVIGITRVHLEEDVGKLFHEGETTLIDYNRAGTPLVEIVTEPDLRSPAAAKAFLQELRLTLRYLGVSNADMEKGELRCDANISLRPVGDDRLYPKTELKNLNSFRSVERALAFEVERQRERWTTGQTSLAQETRGWDEERQVTVLQRTKEGASDYRYLPEPDIPPLHFTNEFLAEVAAETPELPSAKRTRFGEQYGLAPDVAARLVDDPALARYFEEVATEFREYMEDAVGVAKAEAAWKKDRGSLTASVAAWLLNRISVEHRAAHSLGVPAGDLARLLWMVREKTITLGAATEVYEAMRTTKKGPHELVRELGLERVTGATALEPLVRSVIDAHPEQAAQYQAGKTAVLKFFIGQVMRASKGAADADAVQNILEKLLRSSR